MEYHRRIYLRDRGRIKEALCQQDSNSAKSKGVVSVSFVIGLLIGLIVGAIAMLAIIAQMGDDK